MSNIEKRIDTLKQSIAMKKTSKEKAHSAGWKLKLAMLVGMAFGVKSPSVQADNFSNSDRQETPTEQIIQKNDSLTNVMSPEIEDSIKARAAELASNSDFVASFLIEEGENRFDNFNFNNTPMTKEILSSLEESDFCDKLQTAGQTCRSNYNGLRCYRGTKDILKSVGISLYGKHAYMASSQLEKLDEFVEVNCSYAMLKHCPNGTVVVQGKGTTESGHIFVIGENDAGEKVQWCGRQYKLPVNNRRGLTGQTYGKLRVFLPADCLLNHELTAELYEKGFFKNSVEDMLRPVVEERITVGSSIQNPNNVISLDETLKPFLQPQDISKTPISLPKIESNKEKGKKQTTMVRRQGREYS